jgi:hypothetical protein
MGLERLDVGGGCLNRLAHNTLRQKAQRLRPTIANKNAGVNKPLSADLLAEQARYYGGVGLSLKR